MTTASLRDVYRIDSTAVSLREYWWGSPASIPVAALLKLLRIRLPSSTDDPNVEKLAPFEVAGGGVPEGLLRRCTLLAVELQALGFHSPIYHLIEDDLHNARTCMATLVHESGRAWARAHERVWSVRTPPKDVLFIEYVTEFHDRTFLWSLSSKPDLAAPPTCSVVRKTGSEPADLWSLHQARVEEQAARRAVVPLRTTQDLRSAVERHHAVVRNFHLRRGVFVPMTPKDRSAATRNQEVRLAAAAGGSQHPDVLAEIRRQQEQKSSWTTALLVLLVSLALFVGGGMPGEPAGFSLQSMSILIVVLFFHEAGHWVAMRFFGYRNLQMFFIPFLGAAVSGRHYNVPGWKKAMVSLMGPVPGVALGALLGAAGFLLHQPLLLQIALTALVLNGFNLLPILPLDGGWVVQAMLASRSVMFEVIFRALAVLALLAAGLAVGDKVLSLLGVLMLLGLPAAYKLARITGELRKSGLEAASPDDQTIPAATAEAIITKVREAFPRLAQTKAIAMHTLHVFESLNARPPGMIASLGLAFAQGASLFGAVVFAVLIVVGQQADLGSLLRAAQTQPAHTLDPGTIAVWRGADARDLTAVPHNVIVATLAGVADTRSAYLDLQQRAPAKSAVGCVGQTLLLALPADDDSARKTWLAAMQGKTADLFVATPQTPASLRVSCLTGSSEAATALEQEATDYFLASRMHVIPPWMEPDARTGVERAAHSRARRTHARATTWAPEVLGDERLKAWAGKVQAAQKAGDTAEVARLRDERTRLMAELRLARLQALRADPAMDLAVLDRHGALGGDSGIPGPSPALLAAEIGPLLGQLPLVGDAPDLAHGGFTATGFVGRDGLLLTMPFVRFGSSFEGPPAFLRWLSARGCTDLRYQFDAGQELGAEEDEGY